MQKQFTTMMAKAAEMIGVKVLQVTPPAANASWSVSLASESDRDLMAAALEKSGMHTKTASRKGKHYIFEA